MNLASLKVYQSTTTARYLRLKQHQERKKLQGVVGKGSVSKKIKFMIFFVKMLARF